MKKILAGNWKLNKNTKEVKEFFHKLSDSSCLGKVQVAIFPALVTLQSAIEASSALSVLIGSQNSSEFLQGAYTGEVSAQVVKEMGAKLALLGHSERRTLFAETDAQLAKKLKQAQDSGLKVCFCIGETLDQREQNKTESVLKSQLEIGLSLANKDAEIWIAYEPVWAIGTGKVASSEQVESAHLFVKQMVDSLGFKSSHLLYGGSVKPENAKALSSIANVDGFLVGGAALEVSSLEAIANAMA